MTSNYPPVKGSKDNEKRYTVEKIIEKRVLTDKKGLRTQYLIKWGGYTETTWEDEDNLENCQHLLIEFKEQEKRNLAMEDSKKRSLDASQITNNDVPEIAIVKKRKTKLAQPGETIGFQFSDSVESILGGRMKDGMLQFYIKWKGKDSRTFVPASICNQKIPQQVIEFYESRLSFGQEIDDNSSEEKQD
jgi:chromobox protein 5